MEGNNQVSSRQPHGPHLIQRIRVPLGFVFGTVYLFTAQPTTIFLSIGLVLALAGILLRIWAAGHLRKHRELTVSGPYRWTRNPLYLGSFIMGIGFSTAASVFWIPLLFIFLFLAVYLPVMKREEAELTLAYGGAYRAYRTQVPIFFPTAKPSSSGMGIRFSIQQALANREYNAVVGFLIVSVYLIVIL
jgi:protein-S-isoprenylcysteine O-methyltransferase Ste14